MKELRYTLLSDGSSDRALLPLLTWLLRQRLADHAIQAQWADLRRLPKPPRGLSERMQTSLDLYPCDLLFVHRDAEGESRETRVEEIHKACLESKIEQSVPVVPVVPVRMQEAWLLFDEAAIRQASGNPNGKVDLQVSTIPKLESLPDPKQNLHELLRNASELKGRRLKKFSVSTSALRVAEFIEDFSPLRVLRAFKSLEEDLDRVLSQHGW